MVTINDSSLTANVYKTLYDFLKGKASANKFNSSSQPTITAAYIDRTESFPQIVIEQPQVDSDDYTFDRSNNENMIQVVIDVYTSGTSKNKDRSIITDDIRYFLKTNKFDGIMLISLNSVPNFNLGNENKVLSTTISISYKRR